MIVDNFSKILSLIDFTKEENKVMYLQILKRKKDGDKNCTIHTYLIRHKKQLLDLEKEIKLLCDFHNARAYINIAPKSLEDINNELMCQLASNNKIRNIVNPLKMLGSAVAKAKPIFPRWIIDIDKEDIINYDKIITYLVNNEKLYMRDLIIIPTVHGCHIIPNRYKINTEEFSKAFPGIMIHKNAAGTLLYTNTES